MQCYHRLLVVCWLSFNRSSECGFFPPRLSVDFWFRGDIHSLFESYQYPRSFCYTTIQGQIQRESKIMHMFRRKLVASQRKLATSSISRVLSWTLTGVQWSRSSQSLTWALSSLCYMLFELADLPFHGSDTLTTPLLLVFWCTFRRSAGKSRLFVIFRVLIMRNRSDILLLVHHLLLWRQGSRKDRPGSGFVLWLQGPTIKDFFTALAYASQV